MIEPINSIKIVDGRIAIESAVEIMEKLNECIDAINAMENSGTALDPRYEIKIATKDIKRIEDMIDWLKMQKYIADPNRQRRWF